MRILALFLLLSEWLLAASQPPLSFVLNQNSGEVAKKAIPLPNGDIILLGTRKLNMFSSGIGPGPQHTLPLFGPGFGNGNTIPVDGAVDKSGNIWLVGTTDSDDFPLVKPISSKKQPYRSTVFVMKLDPTASQILFSSFLGDGSPSFGGSLPNVGCCASSSVAAIALDNAGNAYVLGNTWQSDFPTTLPGFGSGAPSSQIYGPVPRQQDAFLVKIAADSSALVFSELIGANTSSPCFGCMIYTNATSLAVDSSGNVTIAGGTNTINFPVTPNAFQPVACKCYGYPSGFVSRISSDGKTMLWSSYLGSPEVGVSGPFTTDENVQWMALDREGNVYLSGTSLGVLSVTVGALQSSHPIPLYRPQPYVAKVSTSGGTLLWATYLGGSAGATIHGVALDPSGNLFVTGATDSPDFPSLPGVPNLGPDFVLEFNATGTALQKFYRLPVGTTSTPPSFDNQGRLLLLSSNGSLLRFDADKGLSTPAIFAVTNTAALTLETGWNYGELLTIIGARLGPAQQLTGHPDAKGVFPTTLGGIQVMFGDVAAPLLDVSENQITLQSPFLPETHLGPHTGAMKIITVGSTPPPALSAISNGSVAIFQSSPGWAAALNENATVNSPENPAKLRSLVTIFVNGLFCSDQLVSGLLTKTAIDMNLSFIPYSRGVPLAVWYSGTAPGLIDGICQFNFRLPNGDRDPEITLISPYDTSRRSNTVKVHAR